MHRRNHSFEQSRFRAGSSEANHEAKVWMQVVFKNVLPGKAWVGRVSGRERGSPGRMQIQGKSPGGIFNLIPVGVVWKVTTQISTGIGQFPKAFLHTLWDNVEGKLRGKLGTPRYFQAESRSLTLALQKTVLGIMFVLKGSTESTDTHSSRRNPRPAQGNPAVPSQVESFFRMA